MDSRTFDARQGHPHYHENKREAARRGCDYCEAELTAHLTEDDLAQHEYGPAVGVVVSFTQRTRKPWDADVVDLVTGAICAASVGDSPMTALAGLRAILVRLYVTPREMRNH